MPAPSSTAWDTKPMPVAGWLVGILMADPEGFRLKTVIDTGRCWHVGCLTWWVPDRVHPPWSRTGHTGRMSGEGERPRGLPTIVAAAVSIAISLTTASVGGGSQRNPPRGGEPDRPAGGVCRGDLGGFRLRAAGNVRLGHRYRHRDRPDVPRVRMFSPASRASSSSSRCGCHRLNIWPASSALRLAGRECNS
jgi:hypothetical protein